MLSKETHPECLTEGCPGILLTARPNWEFLSRGFGRVSKGIFTDLCCSQQSCFSPDSICCSFPNEVRHTVGAILEICSWAI